MNPLVHNPNCRPLVRRKASLSDALNEIARKISALRSVSSVLGNKYRTYRLKAKTIEQIFTAIYENQEWAGKHSASGPGSTIDQTRTIIREIPTLLYEFNISTILDIPCGDFNWMKEVHLSNIDYTGADIVKDLIRQNVAKYTGGGLRFERLNLIEDELPKVDLVLCRDCLVHFSFADVFLALHNICDSGSRYLLTTTFTGRTVNSDILTGQWHVLNLELAPFMLPRPLRIINEGCTENSGAYEDKSLGLWSISEIRNVLARRC